MSGDVVVWGGGVGWGDRGGEGGWSGVENKSWRDVELISILISLSSGSAEAADMTATAAAAAASRVK